MDLFSLTIGFIFGAFVGVIGLLVYLIVPDNCEETTETSELLMEEKCDFNFVPEVNFGRS